MGRQDISQVRLIQWAE